MASLWKWAAWIECSPVEVVTDHKSLEDWIGEYVQTQSAPTGRRARWHEVFSQFSLTIVYKPGGDNIVAEAMSRWAYPASTAKGDVCTHGAAEFAEKVKEMEREQEEGRREEMRQRTPMQEKENESYKLVGSVRDEALKEIHVPKKSIKIDLFASQENAQEAFFITPKMNAFTYDWSKLCSGLHDHLWANPPVSMMEKVITKAIMEPCKLVLCVPLWKEKPWWKVLQQIPVTHTILPHTHGIYVEGWKHDVTLLPHPTWNSAIFLVDTRKWHTTKIDPSVKNWVKQKSQGKNWLDLTLEMQKFANVMVTLRSGKEVRESTPEGTMEAEDSEEDIPLELHAPVPDGEGEQATRNPPEMPKIDIPLERSRFQFWHNMSPEERAKMLYSRQGGVGHRKPPDR